MSDEINDLIAEARERAERYGDVASGPILRRLADALEAATRQPSEDDREAASVHEITVATVAFAKSLVGEGADHEDHDYYRKHIGVALDAVARAAVPDAATERIREAVSGHPECDRYSEDDVISCGWKSAYASVVAALYGAPEPEWEYRCTNNINTTGLLADPAIHARQCSGKIERRRKAGPWLPVEGESK